MHSRARSGGVLIVGETEAEIRISLVRFQRPYSIRICHKQIEQIVIVVIVRPKTIPMPTTVNRKPMNAL